MSAEVDDTLLTSSVIEPLFAPWEEPNKHRTKPKSEKSAALVAEGRRPSTVPVVQNLRAEVSQWRRNGYPGASQTTRELFAHWFSRDHQLTNADGEQFPFSYYFCQREAIETFVYLREYKDIGSLSGLIENFGPGSAEERFTEALGVEPNEDRWPRYAFKIATGAGKTKCMSLAIVWSYFHALRESESPMAKHSVLIAPNLIVFERLKDDFGHGKIFYTDPLVPPAWRADFNPSVVLQDEPTGMETTPIIYLTNIHRLYDIAKKKGGKSEDSYDWIGPNVSKAKARDMSQALRERITSHSRLLILNDEAHHVWDPDSAWNECIEYLQKTIEQKTGNNLSAQLDFSATPKDNKGNLFRHIVCDAPLGEAIDAGIVKTPIIGSGKLPERSSENAADKYQNHLLLGYNRWLDSYEEWRRSGKKALMFVMTEDAESANQIAEELNTNPAFQELNGRTLNLHTRLKGKMVKKGKGTNVQYVFKESEKDISDEDLRELRELARDLDQNTSQFRCIVSVLMLREGWDVKNVTTIVPLRAFTAKANILAEQTLGRGLRRMTPPGQANELVTVVEHKAFANLYQGELAEQGVFIDLVDADKVPRTTISIFPDPDKDLEELKLLLPTLSHGVSRTTELDNLTIDDIKKAFSMYAPLPLGEKSATSIDYVGKHLITNEIIHQMTIELPTLLQVPSGCISFYRTEIEKLTKLPGLKKTLEPLLIQFVENILFEKPVSIFDDTLRGRFADDDVREHIRATFVPLVRARTTLKLERKQTEQVINLTLWKPFQVAKSHKRPVFQSARTPFNLVPCDNQFELALAQFLDKATDVVSFAKNTGPQCLRIDYIDSSGQPREYKPDFIARLKDGKYFLLEPKGREDKDVPLKTRNAVEWCKSASTKKHPWQYVFVPETLFQTLSSDSLAGLARAAAPALAEMIAEAPTQLGINFADAQAAAETASAFAKFIDDATLKALPDLYRSSMEEAITLFTICQNHKFSFSPVFSSLLRPLDAASRTLITNSLSNSVPVNSYDQDNFFDTSSAPNLRAQGQNLRKTLVYKSGLSPIGLLKFCLTFQNRERLGGVFQAILTAFKPLRDTDLPDDIEVINDFRNTYIAHPDLELKDANLAERNLKHWIDTIVKLYRINYPV